MTHLLFDDEGRISRRQWWLATLLLLGAYMLTGVLALKLLGGRGLDRPLMLFVSIAILVPFYSVNAKRFRTIGRRPELALTGAILSATATLSGIFLPIPSLNTALGIMLILVILWFAVDLGLVDHTPALDVPVVDPTRSRS